MAYAAEHWPSHLQSAQLIVDDGFMDKLFQLYDTAGRGHPPWFAIYWKATRPYGGRPSVNALHLTALLRHEQALSRLLQTGYELDIDARDDNGRTALIWASEYGHERVVQMLLDKGADVNAQGDFYGNALQAASYRGHEGVVQMLLGKGADVNAQGGFYGNALRAASNGSHEKVV